MTSAGVAAAERGRAAAGCGALGLATADAGADGVSADVGATDAAASVTGAFASDGGIVLPRKSIGTAINAAPTRTALPIMSAGVVRVAVAADAVLTPLADCHDGGGVLILPLNDCQPGADDVCGVVANGIENVE